jgi:hypothetical protein
MLIMMMMTEQRYNKTMEQCCRETTKRSDGTMECGSDNTSALFKNLGFNCVLWTTKMMLVLIIDWSSGCSLANACLLLLLLLSSPNVLWEAKDGGSPSRTVPGDARGYAWGPVEAEADVVHRGALVRQHLPPQGRHPLHRWDASRPLPPVCVVHGPASAGHSRLQDRVKVRILLGLNYNVFQKNASFPPFLSVFPLLPKS